MIKLLFKIQNELFTILVDGKEVYYSDRKLKNKTRLIPKDPKIERQIILSRNKIPRHIIDMFELTDEEKAEYDSCTNELELSKICIKDAKKNNAILIKEETL